MKTTSISDLHTHTSELVREAADGAVIVIERRGEPVAELRPLVQNSSDPKKSDPKKKVAMPDMKSFWKEFPQVSGDSGRFLEEAR